MEKVAAGTLMMMLNMKSVQFNPVGSMGQREAPTANPEVAALSGS